MVYIGPLSIVTHVYSNKLCHCLVVVALGGKLNFSGMLKIE